MLGLSCHLPNRVALEPGHAAKAVGPEIVTLPLPLLSVSGRRCMSFEVSERYRWHSIEASRDLCVKRLQKASAFLPARRALTPGCL